MSQYRTNILLGVLLFTVTTLTVSTRVDYTQPNIEILPDMKYTPAYTAYSPNSVFANGRTLQAPVAGTVARGRMPLHFEATAEDALRAGEELANPFHHDVDDDATRLDASIQRGGDIFRVFCVCCHGPTGGGDGPVAMRGFPPPPSLSGGKSTQMKDGQLFHILTLGQGNMPDFNGQLSREERWDVINYIRRMQATLKSTGGVDGADALPATNADESDAATSVVTANENQPK